MIWECVIVISRTGLCLIRAIQLAATIMAGIPLCDLARLDARALSEIDAAFNTVFGNFHTSPIRIATNTQKYKEALALYLQHCLDAVKAGIARLEPCGLSESFLDDIRDALAWPDDGNIPYPFPTRSFVAWIFDLFGSIPNAVNEVSHMPTSDD